MAERIVLSIEPDSATVQEIRSELEPYGFSNDARGLLGPPGFADAAMSLDGGDSAVVITLIDHDRLASDRSSAPEVRRTRFHRTAR